jgi:penicillin amidase
VEILNQCIVPTDRILQNPKSKWFEHRSRAELVALSLREACIELSGALGADMSEWRWGRFHSLEMNHSLGRVPLLKTLLRIGPLPTGGTGTTINLGFYRHSNPYAHTVGPSLRFVIDMSRSQNSEFILPSGQSGHPWSIHYRDQSPLWLSGQRIKMAAMDHDAHRSPDMQLELLPSL